ncbi:hypothetical protein IWZ00DRAFT_101212, partial [Phyllosticta capitalensis]
WGEITYLIFPRSPRALSFVSLPSILLNTDFVRSLVGSTAPRQLSENPTWRDRSLTRRAHKESSFLQALHGSPNVGHEHLQVVDDARPVLVANPADRPSDILGNPLAKLRVKRVLQKVVGQLVQLENQVSHLVVFEVLEWLLAGANVGNEFFHWRNFCALAVVLAGIGLFGAALGHGLFQALAWSLDMLVSKGGVW